MQCSVFELVENWCFQKAAVSALPSMPFWEATKMVEWLTEKSHPNQFHSLPTASKLAKIERVARDHICRTDVQLYQKWYCNQSWGNGSDAVLSPSHEPAESILSADVLVGRWTLWLFIDRFLGHNANFRNFFLGLFRWITASVVFNTTALIYCVARVCVISFKFQDFNLMMEFDVFWSFTKIRVECKQVYRMRMEKDEISVIVQCNLNELRSKYLVLCWQRVYVVVLMKAGFPTDCAEFTVVLSVFAWSRVRW